MKKYHGVIIDISQKDSTIINKLKVLGKRKDGRWLLYKVVIDQEKLEKVVKELQENMVEKNFYCHFYKDYELIIVFRKKVFKITTDKSTWNEAIEYGKSLGIPKNQLDFYPYKIEHETY